MLINKPLDTLRWPSMYTTYALHSSKYEKIYIGFTSDLDDRFLSHNKLATKGWTVRYRPWEIVHTEEFRTKAEAMKREKELKSAKGRRFIWSKIKGE
jgi:putative endonuclease